MNVPFSNGTSWGWLWRVLEGERNCAGMLFKCGWSGGKSDSFVSVLCEQCLLFLSSKGMEGWGRWECSAHHAASHRCWASARAHTRLVPQWWALGTEDLAPHAGSCAGSLQHPSETCGASSPLGLLGCLLCPCYGRTVCCRLIAISDSSRYHHAINYSNDAFI